jgi:hypothetical protein
MLVKQSEDNLCWAACLVTYMNLVQRKNTIKKKYTEVDMVAIHNRLFPDSKMIPYEGKYNTPIEFPRITRILNDLRKGVKSAEYTDTNSVKYQAKTWQVAFIQKNNRSGGMHVVMLISPKINGWASYWDPDPSVTSELTNALILGYRNKKCILI